MKSTVNSDLFINRHLGLTNIDPIENGLMFERFLNPSRQGAPDIDTDVSDRDLLIELLREEFGDLNVIPISNYNTFKLKSLVKDVSRFYGIPFAEVNPSQVSSPNDQHPSSKPKYPQNHSRQSEQQQQQGQHQPHNHNN